MIRLLFSLYSIILLSNVKLSSAIACLKKEKKNIAKVYLIYIYFSFILTKPTVEIINKIRSGAQIDPKSGIVSVLPIIPKK